ncbi:hypothetical protein NPIL_469071 [Nephila pilipes]|uniref:Uncharacterized protein n=1 Tax=Nephila pilipes TaxID=299642 RepID=A0A8X6NQJ5_NEPPI|nr:hypothetical protein NPIL_469071 [Nephila pilipes]
MLSNVLNFREIRNDESSTPSITQYVVCQRSPLKQTKTIGTDHIKIGRLRSLDRIIHYSKPLSSQTGGLDFQDHAIILIDTVQRHYSNSSCGH